MKKYLLIVVVVLIAAIPFWWRQRSARTLEMAAAIRNSPHFSKPITVEASSKTSRSTEPLSLEALTLRDAGLLTIEHEPGTPASHPPSSPEPPLIRTIRRTYQARLLDSPVPRLVPKDIAATRNWQAFEDPEHQRCGWIVPVGTREFLEVTSIVEAGAETAQVEFSWNWKPNNVGWHFDINEQTRKLSPRWKRKSYPDLSSAYPFKGIAELGRVGDKWEVKSISWNFEMPERAF